VELMKVHGVMVVALCALVPPPVRQEPPKTPAGHPLVRTADDGATCLVCHKKVASHQVLHAPVAGEDCASCHTIATKGQVSAIGLAKAAKKDSTAPLCLSCHDELAATLKAPHTHEPAASGDCTSCHDPHGSAAPFLLASDQRKLCTTCHDGVAEALQGKTGHAPATASCTICHNPHGAPLERQLRVGVNVLCRACHALPRARPSAAEASKTLGRTLADNEAALLNAATPVMLDAAGRSGHPIDGHPVTGRASSSAPGREMTCVTCHDPHGAPGAHLLQHGAASPTDLCVECHK
jgi:predicted CXXCH cytochrome family protein